MLNKKFGVILLLAAFFTACKSMPAVMDNMKVESVKELAAWEGEWVSLDVVKDDDSLNEAYKEVSSKMEHYTVDGVKAAVADMYASPVVSAKFDGTNTIILTIKKRDGSTFMSACEYKYLGKQFSRNNDELSWETFQAVTETKELRGVKYLAILPPHKHGEGQLHWHARFSPYSIDWLINGDSSWPTYVPASAAKEEMLKSFREAIKAMPKWLPVSPFESYAVHGKWINSPYVFENTSKEVEAVYSKIIKEYAGKNPKGGDFTKAELVALLQKPYGTLKDFSHFEFIVKDGKNELVIYNGEKEIFRSSYKRIGAVSETRPYMTMLADKKDAGKFSLISFVVVHGAPNYHFHLWYGANVKELEAQTGTPTCYKADISDAVRAESIEKSCRRALDEFIK